MSEPSLLVNTFFSIADIIEMLLVATPSIFEISLDMLSEREMNSSMLASRGFFLNGFSHSACAAGMSANFWARMPFASSGYFFAIFSFCTELNFALFSASFSIESAICPIFSKSFAPRLFPTKPPAVIFLP
ncbi:Uncharacterised protein [uncultured archaeon]|nr:Uncharacterised protein [uncultured archaeon]